MKYTGFVVVQNIQKRMLELNFTQKSLAVAAEIQATSLNAVLKMRRPPGRKMLERIANALKCKVEDLYVDQSLVKTAPNEPSLRDLAQATFSLTEKIEKLEAQSVKDSAEIARLANALTAQTKSFEDVMDVINAYRSCDKFPFARDLAMYFLTGKLPAKLPHQEKTRAWKLALDEGIQDLVKVARKDT